MEAFPSRGRYATLRYRKKMLLRHPQLQLPLRYRTGKVNTRDSGISLSHKALNEQQCVVQPLGTQYSTGRGWGQTSHKHNNTTSSEAKILGVQALRGKHKLKPTSKIENKPLRLIFVRTCLEKKATKPKL